MSWLRTCTRFAAVLVVLGVSGCVTTTPGYRYVVDVGGDYYYDERPAAASVQIMPSYGTFGYGSPGGWYGSVGFGFGTHYGLGGYYGPTWGAFGPRHVSSYWRPPYYYTPRYVRPPHYYRPPYQYARPLPWRGHDSANAWRAPPRNSRHTHGQNRWNRPLPSRESGNRTWRENNSLADGARRSRSDNRAQPAPRIRVGAPPPGRSLPPTLREAPQRNMAIQLNPNMPPQRTIAPPPSRQPLTHANRGFPRATDATPLRRGAIPTGQPRRASALMAPPQTTPRSRPGSFPQQTTRPAPRAAAMPPSPMPQARPAAPVTRATPSAPRGAAAGPRRGNNNSQRHR